ncbi:hypothetical protein [Pseudokineococcus sp. 1T1Z-3]|uniref:hypothetical protein n=1 Tax=Pseudokineococcus sp. 1T1Z-3 TaxID=3132745 RepID=UPI0030B233DE
MKRRRDLPRELHLLADDQARCLSRRQLRRHDVDADTVARRVRSGSWQRAGPLVVVPRHASRSCASWTRVRTTTRCDARDVTSRGGLPVHRVERAALDAAAWSSSPRTAGGLLAAVVAQRLTTAERLLAAAEADPPGRHRQEITALLSDIAGGSHSMAEVDLVALCRAASLPLPRRQGRRRDAAGRVRHLDAQWVRPDGSRLVAEVDGIGHMDPDRWYDDLLRAADVTADPRDTLLRPPARALRLEPARVTSLLRWHLHVVAGRV